MLTAWPGLAKPDELLLRLSLEKWLTGNEGPIEIPRFDLWFPAWEWEVMKQNVNNTNNETRFFIKYDLTNLCNRPGPMYSTPIYHKFLSGANKHICRFFFITGADNRLFLCAMQVTVVIIGPAKIHWKALEQGFIIQAEYTSRINSFFSKRFPSQIRLIVAMGTVRFSARRHSVIICFRKY